jgi:5-formyltetrahydrofolate cyclo-ligase
MRSESKGHSKTKGRSESKGPPESKSEIRSRLLVARRARPGRDKDARLLGEILLNSLGSGGSGGSHGSGGGDRAAVTPGAQVAAYVPVGTEPGGTDLPELLATAGYQVLLPVLRPDNDLDWAPYRGRPDLSQAGRGLVEPLGSRLGMDAVDEVDLVIVPALAVDRHGTRLGRGGGSYDRALARVGSRIPVLALLYPEELVDFVLPAEPHDRPVSAAVTSVGYFPLESRPR